MSFISSGLPDTDYREMLDPTIRWTDRLQSSCLIHADYYGTQGVVVKKESNRIIFENFGYIRTGKIQMRKDDVEIIRENRNRKYRLK